VNRVPGIEVIVLVAVLLVGGNWLLDNTDGGRQLKCQLLNDPRACVVTYLAAPGSGPFAPAASESPEERARRLAAGEQSRLDAEVRLASAALAAAKGDLTINTSLVQDSTVDLISAVGGLTVAVQDLQNSVNTLAAATKVRPMNGTAQARVCADLGLVELAHSSVDAQRASWDAANARYQAKSAARAATLDKLMAATDRLRSGLAANPAGPPPEHTVAEAENAISEALATADAATAAAGQAQSAAAASTASADSLVTQSRSLAAGVASC
jgi:hypothetical protein